MKFIWIFAFFMGLLAFAHSAGPSACPAPFSKTGGKCTAKRPIRGECPQHSTLDINQNLCVYKA